MCYSRESAAGTHEEEQVGSQISTSRERATGKLQTKAKTGEMA